MLKFKFMFVLALLFAVSACIPAEDFPAAVPPEPTNTPIPAGVTPVVETSDHAELSALLDQLYEGGYILYVRHTHTDRSRGDTDVSLGQCDQQRILSERGQEEALMIRRAYKQLDLPVSSVLSTQYCRALETAVLAFEVPQFTSRQELTETLVQRLATPPPAGTNHIIVAHIGTIRGTVGLDDTFEEGDTLVYRPLGDGHEYVGRIGLNDWPILVELK